MKQIVEPEEQKRGSDDEFTPTSVIPIKIKSSGTVFVKENTGNIKDYYKISSCIGRGKSILFDHITCLYRGIRRGAKVLEQIVESVESSENN